MSDMIPKAKLRVGDYYAGYHRSASVARWSGRKFRLWTIVENLQYAIEEACHPEDDDGFALFTPLVLAQRSGIVPIPLGDDGLSHLALVQRAVFFAEREALRHERTLYWLVRACDMLESDLATPEARAGLLKRVGRLWHELELDDAEREAIRARGEPTRR